MSEASESVRKTPRTKEELDKDLRVEYDGRNIADAEIAKELDQAGKAGRVEVLRRTHARLEREAELYDGGPTEAGQRAMAERVGNRIESRLLAEKEKLAKAREALRGEVKEGDGKREELDDKLIDNREKQIEEMKAARERIKELEKEKEEWDKVPKSERRRQMVAKFDKIRNAIDHLKSFDDKDTPIFDKKNRKGEAIAGRVYEDREVGVVVGHADGTDRELIVEAPVLGDARRREPVKDDPAPPTGSSDALRGVRDRLSRHDAPKTDARESRKAKGSSERIDELVEVVKSCMGSSGRASKEKLRAAFAEMSEDDDPDEALSTLVYAVIAASFNGSGKKAKREMLDLVANRMIAYLDARHEILDDHGESFLEVMRDLPKVVSYMKEEAELGFRPGLALFGRSDEARMGKYRGSKEFFEGLEKAVNQLAKSA